MGRGGTNKKICRKIWRRCACTPKAVSAPKLSKKNSSISRNRSWRSHPNWRIRNEQKTRTSIPPFSWSLRLLFPPYFHWSVVRRWGPGSRRAAGMMSFGDDLGKLFHSRWYLEDRHREAKQERQSHFNDPASWLSFGGAERAWTSISLIFLLMRSPSWATAPMLPKCQSVGMIESESKTIFDPA